MIEKALNDFREDMGAERTKEVVSNIKDVLSCAQSQSVFDTSNIDESSLYEWEDGGYDIIPTLTDVINYAESLEARIIELELKTKHL